MSASVRPTLALTLATAAALVVPLAGTTPAGAAATHGAWVSTARVTSPADLGGVIESLAADAGPSGLVLSLYSDTAAADPTNSYRGTVGVLPRAAGASASWTTPLPDDPTDRPEIAADPVTGDAAALLRVVDGTNRVYATTYRAATHTWSTPALLAAVGADGPTSSLDVAVAGGVVRAVVARQTAGVGGGSDAAVDYRLDGYTWPVASVPTTGTALDAWSTGPGYWPAAETLHDRTPWVQLGVDHGHVYAVWKSLTRTIGTYDAADARSMAWSLRWAEGTSIGWGGVNAEPGSAVVNERVYLLHGADGLVIVSEGDELQTPGTAPTYTNAVYAHANRTLRIDPAGPTTHAVLDTTGLLLPIVADSEHGRMSLRDTSAPGAVLVTDGTTSSGVRSVALPTSLLGASPGSLRALVSRDSSGRTWVFDGCAANPSALCAARLGSGGWSPTTPLPGQVDSTLAQAFPAASSDGGVVVLAHGSVGGVAGVHRLEWRDSITPSPTHASAAPRSGAAALRWTAVTDPAQYSRTLRQEVSISPAPVHGSAVRSVAASARAATVSGLNNGTTYRLRVRIVTANGPSAWSPAVSVRPISPPARVTKLATKTKAHGRTHLTWHAPKVRAAAPVAGYHVYVNGKLVKTLTSRSSTAWTHAGEKKGKKYTYAVRSYNAVGTSSATKVTRTRR